jgi:hypothetical protein
MLKMEYPQIDFAITTCKRLEPFKRTVESFIRNCRDVDLIKRWLCFDDGSSDSDIAEMERLGFQVFRNPGKGHPSNLNNLMTIVDGDRFFHCEDDWWFFRRGSFIRDAMDIMDTNTAVGQVVLISQDDVHEGIVRSETADGIEFEIHDYSVHHKEIHPSFSLNPGLNRLLAWKECGGFNEVGHFEETFGRKFMEKYSKYNTRKTYVVHIGQTTAYELNGTSR